MNKSGKHQFVIDKWPWLTLTKFCWLACNKRATLQIRKTQQAGLQKDFWPTVLSVEPMVQCVVCRLSSSVCRRLWRFYCGKTVRPSQKLSEGVNRKPGSKSSFLGSPPYFYFRFRRYGHRDGRFCLIFARTAKQSVLGGRNWLSSSKPCAYCRIVWLELKLDSVLTVLFVFIT